MKNPLKVTFNYKIINFSNKYMLGMFYAQYKLQLKDRLQSLLRMRGLCLRFLFGLLINYIR